MRRKKILILILLFTSLFFLSSCEEFVNNISKISELQEEIKDNENLINQLTDQINNLIQQEETLKNDKSELENEILTINANNQELNNQVEAYKEQIDALNKKIELLDGENIETYNMEISSLESQVEQLQIEIDALNNEINQNSLEISKLTTDKSTVENELNKVLGEKHELSLQLVNLQNVLNELEDENIDLSTELDNVYDLFNDVSYIAMKANVMIKVEHTNRFSGGVVSQGSGIIFYEDSNYYYVLTNNHVIYDDPAYSLIKYIVHDYKGNAIQATLHSSDPNYDLGLLYFPKGSEDLDPLIFNDADPAIGETVISVGQPRGQLNTISFGEVLSYTKISISDSSDLSSNVKFDVIKHTSPINRGSSGGVLLNTDLEVVGINYAGATTDDSPSQISYAIPLSKVREYLNLYKFVMN